MNRAIIISMLIFGFWGQKGQCQAIDTLLTRDRFLGIRPGETTFKKAEAILRKCSYKNPSLNFKSILWSNGESSTLYIHRYYIRIDSSKLEVTLSGYSTVGKIRIASEGKTNLSYRGLTLGRSRIGEIDLTAGEWESITDNGEKYLIHEFQGIQIEIPGDSLDVLNDRWKMRSIDRITLTKASK